MPAALAQAGQATRSEVEGRTEVALFAFFSCDIMLKEGNNLTQLLHQPGARAVSLATAELILAIQKEFPQVRLVPCEPTEGEDIHLWAYLPLQPEERITMQERIVEIEQTVQDKYNVQTVVVVLPESS